LAAKVAYLLDLPAQRARMADAGMRRVRESLAWNHSVPILLAAYDRAFGYSAPLLEEAAD